MSSTTSVSPKTISVAVTGVGLVGSEFISQLLSLSKPNPFRIVALSSSKHTLFSADGLSITLDSWKGLLEKAPAKSPEDLREELAKLVKPSKEVVFVDNTSNDSIAALYPSFLTAGVHVMTPNKKAFSSNAELFDQILAASVSTGARFLNESTVGAGLPVISTLKDLVAAGDKIKKIEGVFSGTFSYIFNNFSTAAGGGPSFSSVVRTAREKGYTEPHPADDLTGSDVARKLTILARFIPQLKDKVPLPAGYLSVPTTSLIPSAIASLNLSADDFVKRLEDLDADFDTKRSEALKEGNVLRYVGVVDVEQGIVKADLVKYPKDHPFATSLGGSDNIIMFHTERYSPRPLIIQGAGAGAAVTAMGVMSDLLKLV
ncbi:aspartate kinase homoserine dehydrogenase [Panus rudis PR-1116 ss-1]|nr:aspartate kinase homoserine dehydrogenase [Panus rudis PR-1116 ss-1]